MNTVAQQIHEADRLETSQRIRNNMLSWSRTRCEELLKYLVITGQMELLKEIFWIDTMSILEIQNSIILPEQVAIFTPQSRDTGGIIMNRLTRKELTLLLCSFYPDSASRDYVIETVFYNNKFISKNLTDILDVLERTHEMINTCVATKKAVLRSVDSKEIEHIPSTNDEYFTPLVDRIWNLEPGYFDYLHEACKIRLHYVESLFCTTISALAELHENQAWAVDPENFELKLPHLQKRHIELMGSICEFHAMFDSNYPQLHKMIESTLASWILIYKWYCAPASVARKTHWRGERPQSREVRLPSKTK